MAAIKAFVGYLILVLLVSTPVAILVPRLDLSPSEDEPRAAARS